MTAPPGTILEEGFRILLAGLLGGLIGLERDVHGRAAGLRTHVLVALGAALFMVLSVEMSLIGGSTNRDPGRIAAQIVTGIGFLGAGAIIKQGFTIRGLTTASCLWIVAAIGMASGMGKYALATCTTLFAMLTLIFLHWIERSYRRESYRVLTVIVRNSISSSTVIELLQGKEFSIISFDIDRNYETDSTTITFSLRLFDKGFNGNLSTSILGYFENSGIPLKRISWDHREVA